MVRPSQGGSELIDETFFRESRKGQRGLGSAARKRGGRSRRKKKPPENASKKSETIRKAPVMVACDRQQHVTDAVLEHVSNDELFTQLTDQLNVTLKELVTFKQPTLITVSSNVVSMVFFKGVATKYLSRYLGWKRFLKTHIFSEESLLDQEASHWLNPQLV